MTLSRLNTLYQWPLPLPKSLQKVQTQQLLDAEVLPYLATRKVSTWKFDWAREQEENENGLFGVQFRTAPNELLGLISLRHVLGSGYVQIRLLEVTPQQVGRQKKIERIAGVLLAFAARVSFELGEEGYVGFVSKTALLHHYRNRYGAQQIGGTRLMFNTKASLNLRKTFSV